MIVSDDLFFNIVKDWEKKDISTEEKGRFIKVFLEENKISQRNLAKKLNIPYSTLNDWVTGRQMKKYYASKDKNEVNYLLDRLLFVLTRKDFKKDDKTVRLIRELKDTLNFVEV